MATGVYSASDIHTSSNRALNGTAHRSTGHDEPPTPAAPAQTEPAQLPDAAAATDSGDVQERAVIRDHRTMPGTFAPSTSPPPMATPTPKILTPGFVAPLDGTLLPADRYQAPTANLTMVANGLRLKYKSLTTLIVAPPNLPVTQPVEISIGYYSPAGNQRITQSYVRSTGNRFLYNDKEGDGKPRHMTISVSLREQLPNGEWATYALPWQADLDPLYDVAMGPFAFDLISKCDAVGKSEIIFTWYSPDRQYHKFKFSTRAGSRTTIGPFAWARPEVSWSQQLFREQAEFYDEDNVVTEMLWACLPSGCGFSITGLNTNHLLTAKTQLVKGNLKARNDDCQAYFEYSMTKTLRFIPTWSLEEVTMQMRALRSLTTAASESHPDPSSLPALPRW